MKTGETYRIGNWRFDPATATLSRDDEARRLEHRAAQTLALLCRRRGEVVSHDEILAEVWQSRSISPNSVAVVIRDLRRALDDNARQPRHLATVSKRGYRLLPPGERGAASGWARLAVWPGDLITMALALFLTVAAFGTQPDLQPRRVLIVHVVANDTGLAAHDPLAVALGELIVKDMAGTRNLNVVAGGQRRPAGDERLDLRARLILWNGRPTLSLSATDPKTGSVVWAGMAQGPADNLASTTLAQLETLRGELEAGSA
ncbi:MAG TPA: winged helix-turn-helix domain-containing protein [Brevundimonas sp.]|nr:winged helix-turn-helix domain-containing protein [Brevundimonas sp.]